MPSSMLTLLCITFKQTECMSNPEFHEKLHELIKVYEHLSGEPGMSRTQVDTLLANPTSSSDGE